jgi:hypothetical protein
MITKQIKKIAEYGSVSLGLALGVMFFNPIGEKSISETGHYSIINVHQTDETLRDDYVSAKFLAVKIAANEKL